MKTAIAALLAVAVIVLVAGCTSTSTNTGTTVQPTNPQTYTVEMTSTGFSPSSISIKSGDTITFVNKDTTQHWPASAVHPTHSVYPEGGGCIGSKFDACKGLASGESWSFVFTKTGSWKYHDHLNPSLFGTINVA